MGAMAITEIISSVVVEPTLFAALITTALEAASAEHVPEIAPVEALRVNPEGRVPDSMENVTESPLKEGVIATVEFLIMAYCV